MSNNLDQTTPSSATNLSALPSQLARVVAFTSILVGGLLGGLIGFGVLKAQYPVGHSTAKAVGSAIGAVFVAAGTAVLAVLVLRAMGEWRRLNPTADRVQLGDRR